ncbi:MAG: RIP metalloprotease RseP [Alphaproteobacteria bacterium]|nr:RIP metalloprotease RseP [Alphaproteobacteria bacterium]
MELVNSLFHHFWSFVVVLSVIVFIHEFGHYIIAKICGVKIEAFSIGFGRELFGRTDRSGTRWKFSILPLGGYVKMYGDASEASNADADALDAMTDEQKKLTFHHKPLYKKAAIVAAGPVFNFILTIGVLTWFIMTTGLASVEPLVGGVLPGSPAEQAGLQIGDRIERVNDAKMRSFNDIPYTISTNLEKPVTLQVLRGGERLTLTLTPQIMEEPDGLGNSVKIPRIGIKSKDIRYEEVGLPAALGEATRRTYLICASTLQVMGQMITGKRDVDELKGPVGIAQLSGQATEKDFYTVLWLIAMLSANLGLVNLLPIPMLDGGHLMFYLVEALRGRPLATKVQEWGFRFGTAMLVMLMTFTLFNDVRQQLEKVL